MWNEKPKDVSCPLISPSIILVGFPYYLYYSLFDRSDFNDTINLLIRSTSFLY